MLRYIFQIAADPSAPGDYTYVDGLQLVTEGSSQLSDNETLGDVAQSLRYDYEDIAIEFAEVLVNEDGDVVEVVKTTQN